MQLGGGDVVIQGNYVYTRAPQDGIDGSADTGAISVVNVSGASDRMDLGIFCTSIRFASASSSNSIDAENGHNGISLTSLRRDRPGHGGTGSAVTLTTMSDGSASWVSNQFVGQTVQIGTAQAVIASNTSKILTLSLVNSSTSTAWQTAIGGYAPTPAAASYTISRRQWRD